MSRKKILEVNVDDLNFGGVYALVKNVIEHSDKSVQLDIAAIEKFTDRKNVDYLKSKGTMVYYVGSEKNKLAKQVAVFRNLKKLCQRNSYDYVHIHADVANKLLISTIAAKVAGVDNIILHSHSSGVEGDYRIFKKIIHGASKMLLKHFKVTAVACSGLAAKWMYGNAKAFIVKNGIEVEKFRYNRKVRAEVRKELGVAADTLLIGNIGRFSYPKNHRYLIRTFQKITETGINAKLILVGEGPLEDKIRQQVQSLELTKDVIFYGTTNEVSRLYQAMDLFLLPSYFEGLPIVGIEAQASGLPVLFSDRVTADAKMIPSSVFLPINKKCLGKWVETVKELEDYERADRTKEVRDAGYDISCTVSQFLQLYNSI